MQCTVCSRAVAVIVSAYDPILSAAATFTNEYSKKYHDMERSFSDKCIRLDLSDPQVYTSCGKFTFLSFTYVKNPPAKLIQSGFS
jgi:hypothetical protein